MTNTTICSDLASQIKEIPEDSIVSKMVTKDENMKAVVFGFAAGQELSEHTTPKTAILQFLSGEAELVVNGHVHMMQPGCFVHLAPNEPHSVKAVVPTTMLLLMVGP